jgi:hypothetical protein
MILVNRDARGGRSPDPVTRPSLHVVARSPDRVTRPTEGLQSVTGPKRRPTVGAVSAGHSSRAGPRSTTEYLRVAVNQFHASRGFTT